MIWKNWKKAAACLVVMAFLFSIMPVTKVQAAIEDDIFTPNGQTITIDTGVELAVDNFQKTPVELANFTKNETNWNLFSCQPAWSELDEGALPEGTSLHFTYFGVYLKGTPTRAGTYQFTIYVGGNMQGNANPVEFISNEFTVIVEDGPLTANVDESNLFGARATLAKNSGISQKEKVVLTITPEVGKAFVSAPLVTVKDGKATAGAVTEGENGSYVCTISDFQDGAVVIVTGTAEAATYTATLKTTDLTGASASLSKTTEIGADDSVTLTITPENGKAFGSVPLVTADGATVTEPTEQEGGVYQCTLTGFTKDATIEVVGAAEETPTPPPTPEKPAITAGAGETHQIGEGQDMTFTCSGALEDLTGVYVDGQLVDPSNYTLKSGSTILTLKTSFLDTLAPGEHTLTFHYIGDVTAQTEFTVAQKGTATDMPAGTGNPKTGDRAQTAVMLGLLLLTGAVLGVMQKRQAIK